MIVKNEEKYISQCLNSIRDIVDEIIIVDTGSTDKTVEIAESFQAKIYYFQWNNNFSEARNESLKYATKDWILILDADDEFSGEDKDKFKALLNSNLDENLVYFFETLNYFGSTATDSNISVNLNPRLFKNKHGFHYEGAVHNQLVNSTYEYKGITCSIRIYHYGYLEKNIISKDKRKRNITILEQQIEKEPNNKFTYFNLGNEYFAMEDKKKALEYYYKIYEDFDAKTGYSSVLLARIVISNYILKEYDKALEFTTIGIEYFPGFTDLYFLKAMIYKELNKPTLQIKALEKCIELGDPPSEQKFLYGIGGFRAFYELANSYMKLKDYDTAYNYFIETIRSKSDFMDPVYKITHILKKKNTPIDEFKKTIEKFFNDYPRAYPIIADLFYSEGFYKIALEYIKKCEEAVMITENLMILKVKCLVRTGAFDECIKMDVIEEKSSFYLNFSMYKIISGILINDYDYVLPIVDSFKEDKLSDYNKKILQVYKQLVKLFMKESTEVLSEDENEKEYTPIIFEICEIFMINKRFDEFEMALSLLNLVSDKAVLLHLGKLYYKYGFTDIAKKEVIRSIKEFEVFDVEALDILR
jgi:glycosyltransferase involved in cell wall biosynthesis